MGDEMGAQERREAENTLGRDEAVSPARLVAAAVDEVALSIDFKAAEDILGPRDASAVVGRRTLIAYMDPATARWLPGRAAASPDHASTALSKGCRLSHKRRIQGCLGRKHVVQNGQEAWILVERCGSGRYCSGVTNT